MTLTDKALNYLLPEREKEHVRQNVWNSLGAYYTAAIPAVAASLGQRGLMNQVMKADRLPLMLASGQTTNPVLQHLQQSSGMDIGVLKPRKVPLMGGSENAAYVPETNFLTNKLLGLTPKETANWRSHGMIVPVNPKTTGASIAPEVFAHELGHGMAHFGDATIPKFLARSRGAVGGAGKAIGGVDFLRALWGDKDLDERSRLLNQSSAAFGIGSVPTLINEAHASQNAMKLLRSLPPGVAAEYAARGARTLPRAWGTYGLGALATVLSPQVAKWYYQSRANK